MSIKHEPDGHGTAYFTVDREAIGPDSFPGEDPPHRSLGDPVADPVSLIHAEIVDGFRREGIVDELRREVRELLVHRQVRGHLEAYVAQLEAEVAGLKGQLWEAQGPDRDERPEAEQFLLDAADGVPSASGRRSVFARPIDGVRVEIDELLAGIMDGHKNDRGAVRELVRLLAVYWTLLPERVPDGKGGSELLQRGEGVSEAVQKQQAFARALNGRLAKAAKEMADQLAPRGDGEP